MRWIYSWYLYTHTENNHVSYKGRWYELPSLYLPKISAMCLFSTYSLSHNQRAINGITQIPNVLSPHQRNSYRFLYAQRSLWLLVNVSQVVNNCERTDNPFSTFSYIGAWLWGKWGNRYPFAIKCVTPFSNWDTHTINNTAIWYLSICKASF